LASLNGLALGVSVSIEAPTVICRLFEGLLCEGGIGRKQLRVRACLGSRGQRWSLVEGRNGCRAIGRGLTALHYAIDKGLTLGLERLRPDLLFLHAAVFANSECAVALLGRQGAGKSTTALAALDAGLRCYSDELAPIDPTTLRVWSYARALVLKHRPLRMSTRSRLQMTNLGERWYLPLQTSSGCRRAEPRPLKAVVVLERSDRGITALEVLGPNRALTQIYSHCLNPLAHPGGGLSTARRLASALSCYRLESADPELAVGLIRGLLAA
jgi:hypothetical protein